MLSTLVFSLCYLVLGSVGACPEGFLGWFVPQVEAWGRDVLTHTRLEPLVMLRFVLCQQIEPIPSPCG